MPLQCVYILICVMDLLDKAQGSSAASGEKREISGLAASSSRGRHLLAVEDTQANGSSVSPDDAATACFLLTELWEMSKQSQPAGKTETLSLGYQDSCWFCHRWLCASSYPGWDGVRAPVHKHRQHQNILLSAHISLWKEVKHKSLSGKNTRAPSDSNQYNMSAEEVKET